LTQEDKDIIMLLRTNTEASAATHKLLWATKRNAGVVLTKFC